MLTVVIPVRNGRATIYRLLDSLPADLPVVVVDDQSDDWEFQFVVEDCAVAYNWRSVRCVRSEQRGYFAGAVNRGLIEVPDGDILILNQDVYFEDERWLNWLTEQARTYAVIGAAAAPHPAWPNGYVQGTFMFLRRDALEAVGPFDAQWYPLWGATLDWQTRACRRGFRALPAEVPGLVHDRGYAAVGALQVPAGAAIQAALAEEPARRDEFLRTPPRISVIIACHNYGRYLSDAINSLIGGPTSLGDVPGQTFQGFEVIVVDDASTDGSREIVRALADPWRGIRTVLLPDNVGTPNAYNAGIRASYGHYVTVLSADDMREPASLAALMTALDAHPHAMAYDDVHIFRDGARLPETWRMPEYDFDLLVAKNIAHSGIMFPRAAWEDVGGYPALMVHGREDWAMNVALGAKGWCGVHVPEPGYLYRREGQNRTLRNQGADWGAIFRTQMSTLFPAIMAGERPMGCCGNRGGRRLTGDNGRPSAQARAGATRTGELPGAGGMTLLRYVGPQAGTASYYGPVTGTRYLFGASRREGYVDTADVEGLLARREGRHAAFEVVPAAPTTAAPAVLTVAASEPMTPPAVTVAVEVERPDPEASPATVAPIAAPKRAARKTARA